MSRLVTDGLSAMRFTCRAIWLTALLGTLLPMWTHAAEYDRPTPPAWQSRSVVMGRNGMVASSHPLAAQTGLDVLRRGGNAVDAAIAVNAMLGVVEPMSCGIGGDLFAIVWDAKTRKIYGLNASGRSPLAIRRDALRQRGLAEIPEYGLLPWSVPGCVDGWIVLRERFGSQPLADLLQPAIDAAEQGYPVSEIIAKNWQGAAEELQKWPDSARVYLPGGRAPAAGEVMQLPELAAAYRLIAAGGRDAFYRGPIAAEIVRFSQTHGGLFAAEDFERHRSDWVEPVSTTYRGYRLWELPPNGQGIAALQILNILEGYDLKSLGPKHPDYVHFFVEAKKLAYADRAQFYADPDFSLAPVQALISKGYADERRKLIQREHAATSIPHGDPKLQHGDTVYLTVVDKDRNCCSLIQSLYFGFGSQVVPGNVGFAMQNRGQLFALQDDHPNRLEPGKRPFHTIIPALVTRDDKPWLCYGVMGGDMQPQGHVQILINLVDFGMNVQAAGDAARIRHGGSADPTGGPGDPKGGTVYLESGFPPETAEELRRRGHDVEHGKGSSVGGYQGILIDWEHGVLHGASEARKDGAAVGY
ncbi:MAG: gamma-glutamyltransferase [Planctomycetaceae bacterium]|nr:gamma-glutamyltransferase [Planctomycetaceae bacterium]